MATTLYRFSTLCALAIASCGGLAGCERAADAAIERASQGHAKVERDGDSLTLKTPDTEMRVQGGDSLPLPKAYPKDVYLPHGYAINSVMDLEGVNVLNLQSPGTVAGLFTDARESMVDHGWNETIAMQQSVDSAILVFEKEARAATLAFSNGGATGVALSVQLSAVTQAR